MDRSVDRVFTRDVFPVKKKNKKKYKCIYRTCFFLKHKRICLHISIYIYISFFAEVDNILHLYIPESTCPNTPTFRLRTRDGSNLVRSFGFIVPCRESFFSFALLIVQW